MAMATLFCTGVSAMCRLIIGIIADIEPKTAKHKRKCAGTQRELKFGGSRL